MQLEESDLRKPKISSLAIEEFCRTRDTRRCDLGTSFSPLILDEKVLHLSFLLSLI